MNKPMVAPVISRLAEADRLTFDDPVAAHVPELRRADWAKRATLRDLVANRSGFRCAGCFASSTDGDDGALARLTAEASESLAGADFWS